VTGRNGNELLTEAFIGAALNWLRLGLLVTFSLGFLSLFPLVTVRDHYSTDRLTTSATRRTDLTAGTPANVATVGSRAWCAERSTTT
jgi:hypothetical protein